MVKTRTQLVLQEGGCTTARKQFVMLPRTGFGPSRTRWSWEEGSPTLPITCSEISYLITHPAQVMLSEDGKKNLKLAYSFKISVTK